MGLTGSQFITPLVLLVGQGTHISTVRLGFTWIITQWQLKLSSTKYCHIFSPVYTIIVKLCKTDKRHKVLAKFGLFYTINSDYELKIQAKYLNSTWILGFQGTTCKHTITRTSCCCCADLCKFIVLVKRSIEVKTVTWNFNPHIQGKRCTKTNKLNMFQPLMYLMVVVCQD